MRWNENQSLLVVENVFAQLIDKAMLYYNPFAAVLQLI
ncbi:hypothetical protein A225_1441 [Klebsiella michiganensis E718]|nr:hypothetical protein A225_1441 [Klebsiella michiganensis E718]